MNFVSIPFFCLVTALLVVLPLLKHRAQNFALLLASYVFYGWWNWAYLFVIIPVGAV